MKENSNKQIFHYLLITFALTWGALSLIIFANQFGFLAYGSIGSLLIMGPFLGFAPIIGTAITMKKYGEISSFKNFFPFIHDNKKFAERAFQRFRVKPIKRTLGIVLLFFIVQTCIFLLCGSYNGTPLFMCLPLLPFMIIGGGFEEIGWRGYLQPLLEKKLSFVPATFVVGSIWAVWHLPLWFVAGSHQRENWNFFIFAVFCIVNSFVLSLLYKLTQNVFACVLHHAWMNTLLEFIVIDFKEITIIFPLLLELILVLLYYYFVIRKSNSDDNKGVKEGCLK